MVSTHLSLLQQARDGNELAWSQLLSAYGPLISWWLAKQQIKPQDADEISQEVMIVVVKRLGDFEHSGNVGAFRSWLRRITANQLKSHARKYFRQPVIGEGQLSSQIDALCDDRSQQSRHWDLKHDQFMVRAILDWVKESMEPKTVQVFQKLVLLGQCANTTDDPAHRLDSLRQGVGIRCSKMAAVLEHKTSSPGNLDSTLSPQSSLRRAFCRPTMSPTYSPIMSASLEDTTLLYGLSDFFNTATFEMFALDSAGNVVDGLTFQPVSSVPEPSSIGIVALIFGIILGRRRNRRC